MAPGSGGAHSGCHGDDGAAKNLPARVSSRLATDLDTEHGQTRATYRDRLDGATSPTCTYETERIAEDCDRLAHNPEVAGSNPAGLHDRSRLVTRRQVSRNMVYTFSLFSGEFPHVMPRGW